MKRIVTVLVIGFAGCTDLPDHDDPREVPDEELSCDNLLANGDLDSGTGSWVAKPTDVIVDDRSLPVELSAHSGNYFAWLGGAPSATRSLQQKITVPESVAMLSLRGKVFVGTESTAGYAEDTLLVQLLGNVETVLLTPKTLSNVDETRPGSSSVIWTDFQVAIAKPAGVAWLRLISMNDATNNTNFFFDTLTLKPAGCP
ncbi:MAG TPA: hypothetical protein VIV11_01520 [Kofleriaceae bacterium]